MKVLEQRVQFLKGAGPRKAESLGRLGIETIHDLLHHWPRDHVDRSQLTMVRDLKEGTSATSLVEVVQVSVTPTRRGRQNFRATLKDRTGMIEAVWFNQPYLRNYLKKGVRLMVSGEIGRFGSRQFKSPEYELVTDEEQERLHTGRIVPRYPLTSGITQRMMRAFMRQALDSARDELVEHLPPTILEHRGLTPWQESVHEMHFPSSWKGMNAARRRIIYDELFMYQVVVASSKRAAASLPGVAFKAEGALSRRVARALPFELTTAQKRVLIEIRDDMRRPAPMNRLIEGDVGCGKTLVALLAACLALEEHYQVAFMAPTEILAEQHLRSLRALSNSDAVVVRLLTGRTGAAERKEFIEAAGRGDPGIYVGTHALIQDSVAFANLGLVIVDEQHRFGVRQRAELKEKGVQPDVLVMTATPIPRTLSLTLYGDLDVSVIDELPKGRQEVRTRVVSEKQRETVYEFIRKELLKGNRAFIVYPIIEESEKMSLRAASEMAEDLGAHPTFRGFRVGLMHGRMKGDEKGAVMQEFREGRTPLLVTTTVIEVGVDVPEATVMLVEHPERYGLAQLHQLRGRVGRGKSRATFVLLAGADLSKDVLERLRVLETTASGFDVAERDLDFRGPGQRFGARQHGSPELGFADLRKDRDLLTVARDDAVALIGQDPALAASEHARLHEMITARYGRRAAFFSVA